MKQTSQATLRFPRLPLAVGLSLVLLFFVAACSVQRPETPGEYPPPEDLSPSFLTGGPVIPLDPDTTLTELDPEEIGKIWTEIGGGEIRPEDNKEISAGRYELTFPKQAVSEPTEISIREWTSNILLVDFGPDGTEFGKPVKLVVDYTGTEADPHSPNYAGSEPIFYWYNTTTWAWEVIPGFDDPVNRTYTVLLEHFSLYGLASNDGTAGWELPLGW